MRFEKLYSRVQGIVHKTRQDYYLKSWEKEDWDQEGMFVLYQLLQEQPVLKHQPSQLCIYFKVKFRNYIKDKIRRQESHKRKFDRMPHEDISELSHLVAEGGLPSDERVLLRDRLSAYRSQLSPRLQSDYQSLISGQRFRGRSKMIRELREWLSDFQGH